MPEVPTIAESGVPGFDAVSWSGVCVPGGTPKEIVDRLYRAIEDGIVDLDAQLKERVDALKTQHDLAQASLDRIAVQADTRAMITPDRLAAFSQLQGKELSYNNINDTEAAYECVAELDRKSVV